MKNLLPSMLAIACIAPCAGTIFAQEVCGGYIGIPCDDPTEFCLLADGECCCDFLGTCTEFPSACTDVDGPVCGCDGVTYPSRCEASRLGISVSHACPCALPVSAGSPVSGATFTSLERLSWNSVPGRSSYNLYVRDLDYFFPMFVGACLYDSVPEESVLLHGAPFPGQVWMFQVTALSATGEGSMGYASGCVARAPAAPCTCTLPPDPGPCEAAIPRWFHDFATDRCEEFIWGGCEGNANNFETLAACESACLDVCEQPAVVGECTAALPRWYYSVLSGHCSEFVWGGCGGNENNFLSEQACQDACGDTCYLPPDVGDCDGVCPRWYFDPGTSRCEEFIWGCCGGNRNNFATQAQCEAECLP